MTLLWSRSFTPGSHTARLHGCTCSAVMNAYGRGTGDTDRPLFDIAPDCPNHAVGLTAPYQVEALPRGFVAVMIEPKRVKRRKLLVVEERERRVGRRPASFQRRQCRRCRNWFTPHGGNHRYCSPRCAV